MTLSKPTKYDCYSRCSSSTIKKNIKNRHQNLTNFEYVRHLLSWLKTAFAVSKSVVFIFCFLITIIVNACGFSNISIVVLYTNLCSCTVAEVNLKAVG